MKNGFEKKVSRIEEEILAPQLQVSCAVTPFDTCIELKFAYRTTGLDDMDQSTRKIASDFSNIVFWNLAGLNFAIENHLLVRVYVRDEDMLFSVLNLVKLVLTELDNCKFNAAALPGVNQFGQTSSKSIALDLSQFTIE